jgi:HSP20 family protein
MGRARNPFRGLMDHMSEMNRMREYIESGGQVHEPQERTHATAWIPTTDIFARGSDLVIRCELAGVERDDIDITLSGGVLTISGERRSELDEEEINFYTRERSFGHFRRNMDLPEGIDRSDISADFQDGMLQVSVHGGATAVPEPQPIGIGDEPG